MVAKKGLKVRDTLSKDQEQVLFYLTKEFLTPKDIAYRRGTTPQAVYKLMGKLRKKGYLEGGCRKRGRVSIRTPKNIKKMWELHALHFIIKPYYFYPRYDEIRKKIGNYGIRYREWTIMLHPDSVRIQSREKIRFIHEDKDQAIAMAQESFNRLLYDIQNRYGFEVWKDKKANIRNVNGELARSPSEVGEAMKGKFIQIRGHDGKVCFKVDKSKLAEHEYPHPENYYDDSEVIEPYIQDWLYKKPLKNSQLQEENSKIMKFVLESQKGFAQEINMHKEQLRQMVKVTKGLKEQNIQTAKLTKNMNKTINWINKEKASLEKERRKLKKKRTGKNK